MKRSLLLFASVLISSQLIAGGLVTNTNQSARWTRLMCLDATHTLDAVFYNPAGLTLMPNGFYLSLNNQTIGQTKTILSDYKYINGSPKEYIGDVSAPLFPSVYAAYNTGNFAFSFGFNPIGGGGGAVYEDGLPSFEMGVANLPAMVNAQLAPFAALFAPLGGVPEVNGYDADIYFEGNSVYFGYQLNASYKINNLASVALGGRYVSAKNTKSGYVKDVMIDVSAPLIGGNQAPGDFFRSIASLPGVPAPFVTQLNGIANSLDEQTNVEVDIEQTGSGFTPIFSVNLTPIEELNLAVKYEHQTKLHLINNVIDGKDGNGMFVDGDTVVADIPAMLSVGAQFKANEKLTINAGIHSYFDKNNDYDGSLDTTINLIDKNYIEIGLGVNYSVSENFDVSCGALVANSGVNDDYQSDLNYSLSSYTFGAGIGYKLNDRFALNLGASYSIYSDYIKTMEAMDFGTGQPMQYSETYSKSNWLVGIGIDFSLVKPTVE